MKTIFIYFLILYSIVFISCNKDEHATSIYLQSIQGYAQKGPFINGSTVSIFELNKDFIQTGKNFNSQITDNSGRFSMSNIELISKYILVKVDGYYFNEVSGQKSSSSLTLYALSDISDKTNINANILTHLEKERVHFLISQGFSFSDAKRKAKAEILKIFNIEDSLYTESELLDITQNGDENAILLAISLIFQGYGTVADLSELLADFSNNIKESGTLNNSLIETKLVNNTKYLNLANIRQNIVQRYNDLGITTQIPNFEKYIKLFLDSTKFKLTSLIQYPSKGNYGDNILSDSITVLKQGDYPGYSRSYSVTAYLPVGSSLKIKYGPTSGSYFGISTTIHSNDGWQFNQDVNNWPVYNVLDAIGSNSTLNNVSMLFVTNISYKFEFYENNSLTPTKTKIITW